MKLTRKLSGIIAGGGAVALVAGAIAYSGGIGAAFTSEVTATVDVNVGTIACQISAPGDTDSDPTTVTIDLGQISKSNPGQKDVAATVTNNGDIPAFVNWTTTTSGDFFANWWGHKALPVAQNQSIGAHGTLTYTIGAQWDELINRDMGTKGTVVYKGTCTDRAAKYWLNSNAGGSATQAGNTIVLDIPASSGSGTFPGASVGLDITAGQGLPSSQPVFRGTGLPPTPGAVRLRIVFTDGSAVVVNSNDSLDNGSSYTWTQAETDNAAKTVKSVTLIADNSDTNPFTASITCINYSGTAEFGSGC